MPTLTTSWCVQNNESGLPQLSRTSPRTFSRPFMFIFHVFPVLFDGMDIKQVKLSYTYAH